MWLLAAKILKELTVDTHDREKRKDKYLEYENQRKKEKQRKEICWAGEVDLYIKLKIRPVESFQPSGTMAHLVA